MGDTPWFSVVFAYRFTLKSSITLRIGSSKEFRVSLMSNPVTVMNGYITLTVDVLSSLTMSAVRSVKFDASLELLLFVNSLLKLLVIMTDDWIEATFLVVFLLLA